MTALAWALWGSAVVIALAFLTMRISGLDERRLVAIKTASFTALPAVATLPALGLGLLVALGAVHIAHRPPFLVLGAIPAVSAIRAVSGSRRLRPPASGPGLIVATANIQRSATAAAALARSLERCSPDLIAIQEYTEATSVACRHAGLHDAYPHRAEDPREDYFGSALFSRHRLTVWERVIVGHRPNVTGGIDVAGTSITVANVHIQAPIHRHDVEPWRTAFDELARIAEVADGPTILAGDWNAVLGHAPLRRLLRRHHLADAHLVASRRRWPRTWPTDRRLLPPLLCLDHVVVSADIAVHAVREERITGTDHKAVVAHLRLPALGPP